MARATAKRRPGRETASGATKTNTKAAAAAAAAAAEPTGPLKGRTKAQVKAKGRSAQPTGPRTAGRRPAGPRRNRLGEAWLAERRRRAERGPVSLKKQLAVAGGFVASLLVLTIWLGGFSDETLGRSGAAVRAGFVGAGFTLDHVEVRGARNAQAEEVAAQLALEAGALIFDFDVHAAKARVEELPWVEDAAVLRLLPNRIVVVVDERRPLARWGGPEGVVVLDSAGGVIDGADAGAHDDLPLLEGAAAPQAASALVEALARHPVLARRASAFERVGGRRWDMKTHTGLIVRLPEDGVDAALDEPTREQPNIDKLLNQRRSPTMRTVTY